MQHLVPFEGCHIASNSYLWGERNCCTESLAIDLDLEKDVGDVSICPGPDHGQ